jgi:2-polyprenyl-3-methyl-5-hydroxy-6-metoxy-1,4-benzoquinol methylase
VPGTRERDEYYAGYYEGVPALSPLTRRRLEDWVGVLSAYRQTGRVLEIGCGAGHFLDVARAAGFEAHGTEVSASAIERLRTAGHPVVQGDLPGLGLPKGHFDAVVLFEVIEHLDDPFAYLRECARIVRAGGALFLTTPNFGSLTRRLLADRWRSVDPEHLTLFTARGLRRALQRAGFNPTSVSSRNIDPLEIVRALRGRPRACGIDRQARIDDLRSAVASRPPLRLAKRAVNGVLRVLGWGDTLEAWAQR